MTRRSHLRPTAIIKIEKAGEVSSSGEAVFMRLPLADAEGDLGLVSRCEVQFSSTAEPNAGAIATFQVRNLHPDTIWQMAEAGFVKIEAGYLNHPSRPVQIIFFGSIVSILWNLEAGQLVWTFTCGAFPSEVWAIKPTVGMPTNRDNTVRPIFVGEAIRIISDSIGVGRANVQLPKIFDGDLSDTDIVKTAALVAKATESFRNAVTLTQWTTTKTAIEEMQLLFQTVSSAVQQTFGVVRNYSLLPDVNDPFRVVVADIDSYTGQRLKIDLSSPDIISASPAESSAVTPPPDEDADDAEEKGDPRPQNQVVQVGEFQVVSVFDPKISMGILVEAEHPKLRLGATFKVRSGKHILNGSPLRWRTEYRGPREQQVEVARGS